MPANGKTRTTIKALAAVDAALARPAEATVGELCETLRCHPKTVRRHLDWIRKTFGVLLRYCGGHGLERRYVYPVGQASIFTREAARRLA